MSRSSTCAVLILVLWTPMASTMAQVAADQAEPPPPPEAVVVGELLTEPPTLHNLGFEWFIQGDSNRDASVAVSYRKRGQMAWTAAMPLLRLQGERIYAESRVDLIAPNMFAGSVLDLVPDTEYEVRFVLTDPDGSTRITAGSAGILFYNNTILSETAVADGSNIHWRNNLMLGQHSAPAIFSVGTYTRYTSSDYNGFQPNPDSDVAFEWALPSSGAVAEFNGPGGVVPLESQQFDKLEAYSSATGQDRNSVLVDYGIFRNVPRLDARDSNTLQRLFRAEDFDFRLQEGSAAVDRGVQIPTVTDDFSGDAPDLGALEIGAELPHYGPRPLY